MDSRRRDLFAAAAERAAYESGRPKSQELAELLHPETRADHGAKWICLCGDTLASANAVCLGCGK